MRHDIITATLLPDWLLVEHKPGARVKGGAL